MKRLTKEQKRETLASFVLPPEETNAEYHADTEHIGNSMLRKYAESPVLYNALYVAKTEPVPPPTEAMILGSLVHCLVLEPDEFDALFLVSELKSRRGKGWETFAAIAEAEGKDPILQKHIEHAESMRDALLRSPIFVDFMKLDCEIEQPIRWEHKATGLKLKCKPDQRCYDVGLDTPICLDVKTAADPRLCKWQWHARDFGYFWQAVHYSEGCKAETGKEHKFVFAVVGKAFPHDVYYYVCDKNTPKVVDAWLDREETLAALKKSLETNVWLAKGQDDMTEL